MKFLAVFALAVACASADVSHVVGSAADAAAQVLRFENDVQPDGKYNYGYETSNGISASASGSIKDPNSESPVQVVQGSFKHVGPDGVTYEVTYVADENGFQPQGAHLPVAPEVPEAILRSLEYNAAHPQAAEKPFAQPAPFAPSAPVVSPVYKPQTYKPQAYKPQAYKPFF